VLTDNSWIRALTPWYEIWSWNIHDCYIFQVSNFRFYLIVSFDLKLHRAADYCTNTRWQSRNKAMLLTRVKNYSLCRSGAFTERPR
jgi:hypothetical protein